MIRLILIAFATLGALGISANAQVTGQLTPERPTLRSEAIINGDIVRIGDLVEHAGIVATVPIFRAPDLGYTGTISADAVLEAVRSHALIGVDTGGVRDIVVTRAARTIPVKDVETAIARAISVRFDAGPSKDIVVNLSREMRALYVEPSAQGEPHITHIDYDARSGRFDATLEFPTSAGKRALVRLTGRATATVEIVTVGRSIERGGLIRAADVVIERLPRAETGRDIVTSRDQAIGFAARGNLQPGRPLRTTDLMKPDLVQRNDPVTLVYEAPGIVLTIRGKAAEGGAEGDVISVLNEQSKRTVQGTIVGPGRVNISNNSSRLASNNTPKTTASANAP